MKTGTPDHPKMLDLAEWIDTATEGKLSQAGIDTQTVAVGMMERLWQWVAKYAPAGDVGRYSNCRIANAMGWSGDADALVAALIRIGWLDSFNGGRPIVHDWPEHAEDAVHARLARRRERFADGSAPKLAKLDQRERVEAQRHYAGDASAPDGTRQTPETADGARRRPTAPDGSLPGPGPMPEPTPVPREGRACAQEAPSPAAEPPLPGQVYGGESNTNVARSVDRPPDWAETDGNELWRRACELADAIESAPTGGVVAGRGQVERAGHVARLLMDAGRNGMSSLPSHVCEAVIRRLAGGEFRGNPQLASLLRGMQAYPDGVYPAEQGTRGVHRASRVEQAARIMGVVDRSRALGARGRRGGGFEAVGESISSSLDAVVQGSRSDAP